MSGRWIALIVAAVVLLDQAAKALVVAMVPFGAGFTVIPGFFRIVQARNRGIAFGLFGSSGPLVQTALLAGIVLIVVFIAVQLHRAGAGSRLAAAGLALVLGGAIGNLIDRLARGEVVDFLDVFVRWGGAEHHWPTFNVADSAITVGACLVILAELLRGLKEPHVPRPD